MGATTTHQRMGPEQLLISVTAGTFKMTLTGEALYQQQNMAAFLILHFRDEQECTGYADAQTDSMCPSEVGYNWRYAGTRSFHDAGKGLIVKCTSEAGKLRTNYRTAQMNISCTED